MPVFPFQFCSFTLMLKWLWETIKNKEQPFGTGCIWWKSKSPVVWKTRVKPQCYFLVAVYFYPNYLTYCSHLLIYKITIIILTFVHSYENFNLHKVWTLELHVQMVVAAVIFNVCSPIIVWHLIWGYLDWWMKSLYENNNADNLLVVNSFFFFF